MMYIFRKSLALLLAVAMLATLVCPVWAMGEENTLGVVFSATLDKAELTKSSEAQTVVMTVSTNKGVDFCSMDAQITHDSPLILTAIEGGDSRVALTASDYNLDNGLVGWFEPNVDDVTGVTQLLRVTFTVPANTPAGTYQVGVSDLVFSKELAEVIWEDGAAYATATLTITDNSAPAAGYNAALSCGVTEVTVGDNVAVNVGVSHSEKIVFAASEIVLSYDSEKLSFDEATSALNGATVKAENGVLKLENYGADKNCGTGVYVLSFRAAASGSASVSLTSAAFSDRQSAAHADLTAATVTASSVSVTVRKPAHAVTLPDIYTGAAAVTDGEDYIFTAKDTANYTYAAPTATVGGTPATVTDNGDGSYTVANVTGALVISGTRTAKTYTVTFAGNAASEVTGAATATYGQNYTFTLPTASGWSYSLSGITVGGAAYTGYSATGSQYAIPGGDIQGNIVITVTKSQTVASVTVEGSGAGAAAGYNASANIGSDYTLTLTPAAGYDYTVTATMGGSNVDLTVSGNQYTVANVSGNIVFTVERTVKVDGVSVQKYLALDGNNIWLVTNTAELADGSVSTYGGAEMLWSEQYQGFCYLVIAPTLSADDAAAVVGIATAAKATVDYSMDINGSGLVDVNDAQLTYNMYNTEYSAFSDNVTMEKFLRADVNGDGQVNVSDAAAIVDHILAQ